MGSGGIMFSVCPSGCPSVNVHVNVNVVYTVKQKVLRERLCEEMSLQPISELFTTDGGVNIA